MKKSITLILVFALVTLGVLGLFLVPSDGKPITYQKMESLIESYEGKEPLSLVYKENGVLRLTIDESLYSTQVGENVVDELIKTYPVSIERVQSDGFSTWFKYALMFGLAILVVRFLLRMAGKGGPGRMMSMKNMRDDVVQSKPTESLADVGGLSPEVKEELQGAINLYKKQDQAKQMGVKPAHAVLFHGPPGTGKTMLGKALAHELDATYFYANGAEFDEMFVGVGGNRIHDLFKKAKDQAPSLIFIDELDGVGRKRSGAVTGSNEGDKTLNRLLAELSELTTEDRVFVVGATNFMDILDPALIRPGRFDYCIKIDLPDLEGRKEIVALHAKGKTLDDEVKGRLDWLAHNTFGYSGAAIADIFDKAARRAIIQGRNSIGWDDMNYALDRNLLGNKGRPLTDLNKWRVAYHEAGHALIQSLEKRGSIRMASIVPRGEAGGVVVTIPEQGALYTKEDLEGRLAMYLAGGVAEEEVFKSHSIGVSSDIEQTKSLIEKMVTNAGMADSRLSLTFTKEKKEASMERIFMSAYTHARTLIQTHRKVLDELADALYQYETLTGDEVDGRVWKTKESVSS